jgi:hypothetical protein
MEETNEFRVSSDQLGQRFPHRPGWAGVSAGVVFLCLWVTGFALAQGALTFWAGVFVALAGAAARSSFHDARHGVRYWWPLRRFI